jgi:hypothetical protein
MKMCVGTSDGVQGGHKMYILVRAKRLYFWCSLLLMLLCTKVLVVRGYKLVERGIAPRSLCVGMFECFECVFRTLPWCGVVLLCRRWSRVPPSPFIACKGRGWVTVFGCMKNEKRMP